MATFATLAQGDDWADCQYINEILTSYREHRLARGFSNGGKQAARVNDDDAHYYIWYAAIQSWIEANCVEFIDHSKTVTDYDDVQKYTRATFRTAAGLNTSGFKRSTDGTTFSYGKVQEGDVVGRWIFTELQDALDALRWTTKTGYGDSTYWAGDEHAADGEPDPRPDTVDEYDADSGNSTSALYTWRRAWHLPWGQWPFDYQYICNATHGKCKVTSIPNTGLSFDWNCYGLAVASGANFRNGEGIASVVEDKLWAVEDDSESSGTTTITGTTVIGGASKPTCPLDIAPIINYANNGGENDSDGMRLSQVHFIFKWDWSYTA
jgi:hypothetical protein